MGCISFLGLLYQSTTNWVASNNLGFFCFEMYSLMVWGSEIPKSRCWQGCAFSEVSRADPSCLSQLLVAPKHSLVCGSITQIPASFFMWPSFCICLCMASFIHLFFFL